ncbi:hydrogenase maturation nickel metallochaperone HypA [Congregibacter variabilis]|uniref:Hydrogenase maturation nickel metallochaperone HypA n=1 Tax=Congregibacter variabilis TaxID=3081200 RepID=A0ABZ0I282_9GAMM|nr:hydrogenase maturation nickel metallochaperone HypA [Congregibacter sp. IMCC43200]
MHEAGMIRDLLTRITALASEESVTSVTGVRVWLGALSHISPEHFREHFRNETVGSIAEGALLEIESSQDIDHPQAQSILLRSIDVAEP